MANITNGFKSHGEAGKNKTKEYRTWAAVRNRCTNKKSKRYHEWGGRGITVCDRWSSYQNFLEDMGRAPSPTHSIDRKENDKGYSKENCRWATPIEQSNNTRRTVMYEYLGEVRTIRGWCDIYGLRYKLVALRIWKGWTISRAITEKAKHKAK